MANRSDEITSIIKSAIDSFDAGVETRSVGTVVEAAELGGDAAELLDATTPQEQLDEVLDRSGRGALEQRRDSHRALVDGQGRVGQGAHRPLVADQGRGRVQLRAPGLDRAVTLGHLEGGLRIPARRAVPSGHR